MAKNVSQSASNSQKNVPAIFSKIDKIRPVYDWTDKIIMFICKILLIIDTCVTGYAVLGRQVGGIELSNGKFIHDYIPFLTDPAWTEQVVLTLISYMAVLSAALAIRHETHVRMNAFDNYINKKVLLVLDIMADLMVMLLGAVMLVIGWEGAVNVSESFYESMPWLSRFWMYFPVPLAGLAMIIFELERIYEHIKSIFVKKEEA